ncbi:MAG: sigma-70 family RNA polymerase sigma factor [Eubacteriales bacterium]|nr:sigma-70 family RNA polymerase sigma factor [Eubacteriales bacterium]
MKRDQAEKITTEYLKPIYGFALKRCANLQDAEDLTQEIALKAFRTLVARDDIESTDKFIWTVAHNTLANYYRDKIKTVVGVPIDELAEILPSDDDTIAGIMEKESTDRLHMEIAYLSKLQRRIVIAYYYENKKQEVIAKELGIPLGTVKWHLFEAKKDLKRGMDTMRQPSELKFNPIEFEICGFSGSTGTMGGAKNFLRTRLSQNIAYSTFREAKSIIEIADCLGVSPVYVEPEVEFLYDNEFLIKKGDKYLCNFLIEETNAELAKIQSEMYGQAAKIFANELFDDLTNSGLLQDESVVVANPMVDIIDGKPVNKIDDNFTMWSLIPYIAAVSGENLMDEKITFNDAATLRPDGGKNICSASIPASDGAEPLYFDIMKKFSGPCWNGYTDKFIIWQLDTPWSAKRVDDNYQNTVRCDLSLLDRFFSDDLLSKDEYVWLCERGYMRTYGETEKEHIATLQIVWIPNVEGRNKLLAIGDKIKEKYKARFDAMKAPYIKTIMDATPTHLRKLQQFWLQYIFFSDGWFILHCIMELLNNGKLKPPTEEQRKSLTTIIAPNK